MSETTPNPHKNQEVETPTSPPPALFPLTGASVGTLVAYFATSIPDSSGWKKTLICSVPLITVLANAVGIWLFNWIKAFQKNRERNILIKRLYKLIEDDLKNPNISEDRKKILRKDIDKISQLQTQLLWSRIRSIKQDNELNLLIEEIEKEMRKAAEQ
jgi:hypothetical protein